MFAVVMSEVSRIEKEQQAKANAKARSRGR